MRILDFFRRRAADSGESWMRPRANGPDAGTIITNSAELERFLRAGMGTASGEAVTPESAMRVAAVYRCVTLISGAVAVMPLAIKRRVGDQRIDATDHALWNLLTRRPNPWQTPSQFRRQLQGQLLLRGNGYARKVRSGGRVIALIPLHPDRVSAEQAGDFTIDYRYVTKSGQIETIPQRDMFRLTGMTLDGINGLSVIGYAREAIGLATAAEKHGSALFRNGTNLGAVIQHPKNLSDNALGNLKESLESFRGAGNAGRTLVLEEDMKFDAIGMSNVDAQFLEARGFQRSDIFMFFGVPPHMAGDTTKTTSWGSGIEQQSLGFVAYTLEDWLTTWEQSIARDLIAATEPDLYARFNRAALVRGDIKTRYGAYSIARQWGLATINELRALEDQNPVEGGDELFAPGNANRTGGGSDSGKEGLENDDQ